MTMTLISTVTVGSGGAASIDFNSIAGTFTDLCILVSARSNRSGVNNDNVGIKFNGVTTNQIARKLWGTGSSVGSDTDSVIFANATGNAATASTFGNGSFYIPNYAGSTNKSVSIDTTSENNATGLFMFLQAGLWSSTAAITSISLYPAAGGTSWDQYSTASLYGILKGSGGATVS